jgi:hypothetical protein
MGILRSDHPEDCGRISLWLGLLGAPTAWVLQLQTNYALMPWARAAGTVTPLHVVSGILLACAIAAGITAFRALRNERGEQKEGHPAAQCRLFMATLGVAVSLLFCALMTWTWVALGSIPAAL